MLARLYTASDSALTSAMKKTQLTKIMLLLYSGCIKLANQQAQGKATVKAFNTLVLSTQTLKTIGILQTINMGAVECSYKLVLYAMQVLSAIICFSVRKIQRGWDK